MKQRPSGRRVDQTVIPVTVLVLILIALTVTGYAALRLVGVSLESGDRIRHASELTSDALADQIDEETGVRGYVHTGDRLFLEPFFSGRNRLPATLDELARVLPLVGLGSALPHVDRMAAANKRWMIQVVHPELSGHSADIRVQRLGKAIVDGYRVDAQAIRTALERRSEQVDAQTQGRLRLNFLIAGTVALIFGGSMAYFARRQDRLSAVLREERRIATSLQQMILQGDLPSVPAVDIDAVYVASEDRAHYGGDWYDTYQLPDGRIMFSIGDVTGHGLEAAITMSRVRQTIASLAVGEFDPGRILARANETMFVQGEKRLATTICGYITPRSLEISYATAGHTPPILTYADGSASFLKFDGLPLGVVRNTEYQTFIVRAEPASMLVLYTDGLTEYDRDIIAAEPVLLRAAARAMATARPAAAIKEAVFAAQAPADDVAVLTIAFRSYASDLDAFRAARSVS